MTPEITRSSSNIRNERAELLVHYALDSLDPKKWEVDRRFRVGQSGFYTEFDHIMEDKCDTRALIGQTTCYKERGVSGAEPNKTYEMRETLVEFLLAQASLMFGESDLNGKEIRFFHIVFGDPAYSYSYFHKIRSKCYDLNVVIHPPLGVDKLYGSLEQALPTNLLSDQNCALNAIKHVVTSKNMPMINDAISTIRKEFSEYFHMKFPQSEYGWMQAEAIRDLASEREAKAISISENLLAGIGIKKLYLEAAKGIKNSQGKNIESVVDYIFKKRAFLPEAKKALEDEISHWKKYVDSIFVALGTDSKTPIEVALLNLWNVRAEGKRELVRRMLIKLAGAISGEGTAYPQDIPVKGVTEHNLYRKIFDSEQTLGLISYLQNTLKKIGVTTVEDLRMNICSLGRSIVKDGFDYDVENGTVIKPVTYYIIAVLEEKGYRIRKPKDVLGSTIKGYHGDLFDVDIGPFTSIDVICRDKKPIALFKAKYFRRPEFDRRVKEEGFVSFTSSFVVSRENSSVSLKRHRRELPFVMFVDTDPEWIPDSEPVKQLVQMGWDVFFRIPSLLDFLSLQAGRPED